MQSPSSRVLQDAFNADQNAIYALISNRVPCNESLADDKYVIVGQSKGLSDGNWQVGVMGLVNAVPAANNLPLVAVVFNDGDGLDGEPKMTGFCDYIPNE